MRTCWKIGRPTIFIILLFRVISIIINTIEHRFITSIVFSKHQFTVGLHLDNKSVGVCVCVSESVAPDVWSARRQVARRAARLPGMSAGATRTDVNPPLPSIPVPTPTRRRRGNLMWSQWQYMTRQPSRAHAHTHTHGLSRN